MIDRPRGLALHWQILIAIVAAAIVGEVTRDMLLFGAVTWYAVFDFFGTLFINALKMLIVPLISSSIIVGVAGIGASGHLGRLGGKTLLFYALTTFFAILLGLLLVNIVQPGILDGQPVGALLALDANADSVLAQVGNKGLGDIVQIFVRMVPTNIVQAAAEGSMLGIIFFCLLFGFFMSQLEEGLAEPLFRFWSGVFQVMMKMTEWVMKFAPIGVFGLVARVVSAARQIPSRLLVMVMLRASMTSL